MTTIAYAVRDDCEHGDECDSCKTNPNVRIPVAEMRTTTAMTVPVAVLGSAIAWIYSAPPLKLKANGWTGTPISPLYLPYTSPRSPLDLPDIPYISPRSPTLAAVRAGSSVLTTLHTLPIHVGALHMRHLRMPG